MLIISIGGVREKILRLEKLKEICSQFGDSLTKNKEKKTSPVSAGTQDIQIFSPSLSDPTISKNREWVSSVSTPSRILLTQNTLTPVKPELCVLISTQPQPHFLLSVSMMVPFWSTISEINTRNPSTNLQLEIINTLTRSGRSDGTQILLEISTSTLFPPMEES